MKAEIAIALIEVDGQPPADVMAQVQSLEHVVSRHPDEVLEISMP